MSEQPKILERDGPRGGEYYDVDLSDGRLLSLSRKNDDRRVWLGRPDDPASYNDQPGGIGTIDKLLDEWRARMALNTMDAELYWAGAFGSRLKEADMRAVASRYGPPTTRSYAGASESVIARTFTVPLCQ